VEARGREEARWREEEERRARAAKTINWATVSGGGTAKVTNLLFRAAWDFNPSHII
jgi:hypothetical protein